MLEQKWERIASENHETAYAGWSRAEANPAKVGKGQRTMRSRLETEDPQHRYGPNLLVYYKKWCKSSNGERETKKFFYWLDGAGKDVNLSKCPRPKLEKQCVKYLSSEERMAYEVIVEKEKLIYKQARKLVQTTIRSEWIFVLSTSNTLYVGEKKKGRFHHSSFLAGGETMAAGRLIVQDGVIKAAWPRSGHYMPTMKDFENFISFLRENSADGDFQPYSWDVGWFRILLVQISSFFQTIVRASRNSCRLELNTRSRSNQYANAKTGPKGNCDMEAPNEEDGYESEERSYLTEEDSKPILKRK